MANLCHNTHQHLCPSPSAPQVVPMSKNYCILPTAIGKPLYSHFDSVYSNLGSCIWKYTQFGETRRDLCTVRRLGTRIRKDRRSTHTPCRFYRECLSDRARPACHPLCWERICSPIATTRISSQIPNRLTCWERWVYNSILFYPFFFLSESIKSIKTHSCTHTTCARPNLT